MKELELFTLPNCPACKRLKETLEKEGIEYTNKDTKDFADEWTEIQNITKTYFLPTLKMGDMYFSPNRDFKNDQEAVELIKKVNSGEMVEHEMTPLELRETMKTLLFPGQGSQIVGMGSDFYKNFSVVKEVFSEADEKLKFKLSKIILEGPENELKLTQNTQPAILLVSYSIFTVLKKEFNFDLDEVKYFAGHSLGEYSALLCANALSFTDSLYLLFERGKSMQEAVPAGKGGMLAILGTNLDEINNYITLVKNKGICEIANDNAQGQIIVSGDIEAIDELKKILKENKKKTILLPVSAPFHCSLMKPAAEKMKAGFHLELV